MAEGLTLVTRLLTSSLVPEAVHCTPDQAETIRGLVADRCPLVVGSPEELSRWAGYPFHRGVMACARRPDPIPLESFLTHPGARRLVCAPDLTDAENLGSVFRSALALGWDAVAVGSGSVDPWGRRCARVSMGAVYARPPVALPADRAQTRILFAQAGWTVRALALEPGADDLTQWEAPDRLALFIGNEFEGVSAADRTLCEGALVLPMAPGHDSLNVAVATGIALQYLH